jgi:hydrogenase maturation protein HypF
MTASPGQSRAGAGEHAMRWLVSGVVQGVGFRPFVYRLATELGLRGWVRNCTGQVEVVAAGAAPALDLFEQRLIESAPRIAQPAIQGRSVLDCILVDDFAIRPSEGTGQADIHVPPDYFVCDDCLVELDTATDRRYRYPFINCTQCGPRYTLIRSLPYDRPNTSMAEFDLCPACQREYSDPRDRRFHAEPVACPECGPRLTFRRGDDVVDETASALAAAISALRAGDLVAVKGVGGYHLLCDAASSESVRRLRSAKPRPHKPLALMYPQQQDLSLLRQTVYLSEAEFELLLSPGRPIVLARRRAAVLPDDPVAPGLAELGVMLPYSPLHHLLLNGFGAPLVATSANISGEPVLTEADAVEQRLGGVAQAFLHHNRPIVRPADDPVYRSIAGVPRPLRLGRGSAPLELRLPVPLAQPVLAVGAHMKNTVCLAWGDRAVVSPHIGDMGAARSQTVFDQVCADLQSLYGVTAGTLLCDAHPGYATTRWAQRQDAEAVPVWHHAAHASALIGEHAALAAAAPHLVFAWDGVGLGEDGSLWGGEALYGRPGQWRRMASWRPFRLPGGDRAGREPWRSALAIAWEMGRGELGGAVLDAVDGMHDGSYALLYQAWQRQLNAPLTSAVGRLFDAAAALTGICRSASFEGQGPMWLEALAQQAAPALELPLVERHDGLFETDWGPLFDAMADPGEPVAARAALFHETLAHALVQQARAIRARQPVRTVGLCGGVFQNRRLAETCVTRLRRHGFEPVLGQRVPVNDAGLSFGQVVEYAGR